MLASCVFQILADATTDTIFVLLTELQREIEAHVLADFENDIAFLVRKPGGAHLQRILAGRQIRHLEQAVEVGRSLPRGAVALAVTATRAPETGVCAGSWTLPLNVAKLLCACMDAGGASRSAKNLHMMALSCKIVGFDFDCIEKGV